MPADLGADVWRCLDLAETLYNCREATSYSFAAIMSSRPSVSIVVPVFNGEESLSPLVERLCLVLPMCADTWEVILVNDGSNDRSWKTICEVVSHSPGVSGIDLMRNYGQHNALLCGIRAARNDLIVTLDDDLQNPPEEVPKLIEKLGEGYDVVYGTPQQQEHGLWRNLASSATKLALQTAMGAETARSVSSFRILRADLRKGFETYQGPFVSIDVLLTWATNKFSAIEVRHERRTLGHSNYTLGKLLRHAGNMVTGFSVQPLRWASFLGFSFTLFGFGMLLFVIVRYLLEGSPVAGFAFLACSLSIFSGVQLFALGIIGEYLAEMHYRSMDRPPYAERCRVGSAHEALVSKTQD